MIKIIFLILYCIIILCIIVFRLKKRPVEYYKNFLVITYDNQPYKETNTNNLIETLEKYNYSYKILGEGEEWKGWYGRFKSYYNYISTLDENEYILICDGRDVLLNNQSPIDFMKKAESLCNIEEKIIFGAERHCCCYIPEEYGRLPSMNKDENLNDIYIKFMKDQVYKEIPDYKYDYYFLNFGVFFGKVKNIRWMFSQLKMSEDLDDQGMTYIFYYKNPEKIYLDANNKLIGNNGHEDCDLVWENNKYKNKITNTYPVILHFPGDGDKCYDDIKKKLVKN